ncbi:MAG: hypothetical protein RI565_10220 [Schleiferiaceae bacterium]|nr:hypothetical protein [Schleiferiaceae bacterium]
MKGYREIETLDGPPAPPSVWYSEAAHYRRLPMEKAFFAPGHLLMYRLMESLDNPAQKGAKEEQATEHFLEVKQVKAEKVGGRG